MQQITILLRDVIVLPLTIREKSGISQEPLVQILCSNLELRIEYLFEFCYYSQIGWKTEHDCCRKLSLVIKEKISEDKQCILSKSVFSLLIVSKKTKIQIKTDGQFKGSVSPYLTRFKLEKYLAQSYRLRNVSFLCLLRRKSRI